MNYGVLVKSCRLKGVVFVMPKLKLEWISLENTKRPYMRQKTANCKRHKQSAHCICKFSCICVLDKNREIQKFITEAIIKKRNELELQGFFMVFL